MVRGANMKYYKTIQNGYIMSISSGAGSVEITETEYNDIMSAIQNKPQATDTIDYQLKTDLTWEAYEVQQPDPSEEELDNSEAVEILLGGAS